MTTMTTYQTGPRAGQQIAAQRLQAEREQFAEDLARWAGLDAARDQREACDADRCTCYNCEPRAREDGARNMYAFALAMPLDKLRRRHEDELVERAVDRARRGHPAR